MCKESWSLLLACPLQLHGSMHGHVVHDKLSTERTMASSYPLHCVRTQGLLGLPVMLQHGQQSLVTASTGQFTCRSSNLQIATQTVVSACFCARSPTCTLMALKLYDGTVE